jgi:hypothetical protein
MAHSHHHRVIHAAEASTMSTVEYALLIVGGLFLASAIFNPHGSNIIVRLLAGVFGVLFLFLAIIFGGDHDHRHEP